MALSARNPCGRQTLTFAPHNHMGSVACVSCNRWMDEAEAFPALVDGCGEGACPYCKAAIWRETDAVNSKPVIRTGLVSN